MRYMGTVILINFQITLVIYGRSYYKAGSVVSAAFSPLKEDLITIQRDQINILYSFSETLHGKRDLNLWL